MPRFITIMLIAITLSAEVFAQKMIYDSLVVNFGIENKPTFGVCINQIVDKRNFNAHFIGVHEVNKYLFVPVDRFIAIGKPLTDELMLMFSKAEDYKPSICYTIGIQEFSLTTKPQFFIKNYVAYVHISLDQQMENGGYNHIGNLIYETTFSKRTKAKQGFESVIEEWKQNFAYDMLKLSVCPQGDSICNVPNLLKPSIANRKNLYASIESSFWLDTWLIDAELIFSRPEPKISFFRKGYGFRYRKQEKLQSFESTLCNDQLYYRLSKNFVTITKSKLYLGLNLWNDEEYGSRGFEEIFMLDYSIGQSIQLNGYGKKGLTASVGCMGSLTYIYSLGVSVRPFVTFQIGLKI